jgi:ATP-binding cassette subfamily C (CFTR/MRP) protein 4
MVIDGVDVSKLGLHALRTKISVIPQVPTLFSGCTVRENLDLFGLHSDAAIAQVLEDCHLTAVVDELPDGWDSLVAESGSNFSVGQRQLLCLARALLSRNKILVLDEATASVDKRTDQMLQDALHASFHDGTILAVAHRLDTVIENDYIMVLGNGKLLEFGSPADLLRRDGAFASMVSDTGDAMANDLRQRALLREEKIHTKRNQ